jgi:hypothetical protein
MLEDALAEIKKVERKDPILGAKGGEGPCFVEVGPLAIAVSI